MAKALFYTCEFLCLLLSSLFKQYKYSFSPHVIFQWLFLIISFNDPTYLSLPPAFDFCAFTILDSEDRSRRKLLCLSLSVLVAMKEFYSIIFLFLFHCISPHECVPCGVVALLLLFNCRSLNPREWLKWCSSCSVHDLTFVVAVAVGVAIDVGDLCARVALAPCVAAKKIGLKVCWYICWCALCVWPARTCIFPHPRTPVKSADSRWTGIELLIFPLRFCWWHLGCKVVIYSLGLVNTMVIAIWFTFCWTLLICRYKGKWVLEFINVGNKHTPKCFFKSVA